MLIASLDVSINMLWENSEKSSPLYQLPKRYTAAVFWVYVAKKCIKLPSSRAVLYIYALAGI